MHVKARKKSHRGYKQTVVRVVAVILSLLLVLAMLLATVLPIYAEGADAEYDLKITIASDFLGAQVVQTVRATNDTGYDLGALLFSVKANRYRRWTTAPVEYTQANDAYPAQYEPGGVEIYQVLVDGVAADWGIFGEAEDFLRVECDYGTGRTVEVQLTYDLALPAGAGALGGTWGAMRLIDFYPVLCPFNAHDEEFAQVSATEKRDVVYGEIADYQVTVSAPNGYDVAASGATVDFQQSQDGRTLHTFLARDAREIGLLVSLKVREHRGQAASGVEIAVYSSNRLGAERAKTYAAQALDVLEGWFGAYPAQRLVIAESAAEADAARSDIVFIPEERFSNSRKDLLKTAITEGIAKQWFSLLVGNHPELEPWLDDALVSYLSLMVIEETQGEQAFYRALNDRVLPVLQMTLPGDLYVDNPASRFQSRSEYQAVVRDRGTASIHEVRDLMGRESFLAALRLYTERMAGKNATIADFVAALNDATGQEWDYFLMEMLRTIGDYAGQGMESYGGIRN